MTSATKLKTSAMIASFADPGQKTTPAPFGHALVEAAQRVVIVCDSSKLGRTAFALICPTSKIDTIITDDGAPAEHVEALRHAGVQVQLV